MSITNTILVLEDLAEEGGVARTRALGELREVRLGRGVVGYCALGEWVKKDLDGSQNARAGAYLGAFVAKVAGV
jgi:hypothetical protein